MVYGLKIQSVLVRTDYVKTYMGVLLVSYNRCLISLQEISSGINGSLFRFHFKQRGNEKLLSTTWTT